MKPDDFVLKLKEAVIEENISIYRDVFKETTIDQCSDIYWKKALFLFNSLSIDDKEIFFEILRQVMIDTTSNILGVIDGVNLINGIDKDFTLIYEGEVLNGDLQSIFIENER